MSPNDTLAQESPADQGLAALQMVQTLVAESVKSAMSSVTTELLEADRHMSTSSATGPSGESGSRVACLPSDGQLPPAASLANMPVVPLGPSACFDQQPH